LWIVNPSEGEALREGIKSLGEYSILTTQAGVNF